MTYAIIQQNAIKQMGEAVALYQTTGIKNSFLVRVEQLVNKDVKGWL